MSKNNRDMVARCLRDLLDLPIDGTLVIICPAGQGARFVKCVRTRLSGHRRQQGDLGETPERFSVLQDIVRDPVRGVDEVRLRKVKRKAHIWADLIEEHFGDSLDDLVAAATARPRPDTTG